MKKLIAFTSAAAASLAIYAAPQVSDVTLTQDASKTVTITYKLKNEPGIVTVDIQTNAGEKGWVSIGGQYLTYFKGDANKLVQPSATETRTITWKPRKAWPDNEVTENVKAVISAWATNAPPDYMAVSLVAPNSVHYYTCAENVPFGISNDLYKTEFLLLRKIPAANVLWRISAPSTETGFDKTREAARLVRLDEDYYIGVYEFTQRQWELIMNGDRPSKYKLESDYATRPVEQISWNKIRGNKWPDFPHDVTSTSLLGALRTFTGIDGFDLPTEAQWEFACRAGCGAALYDGTELEKNDGKGGNDGTSDNLARLGRCKWNGGFKDGVEADENAPAEYGTAKAGTYAPNDWWLYDMLGNVAEWCLDWYEATPSAADFEAGGPTSGTKRMLKGGCFVDAASSLRVSSRANYMEPNLQKRIYGFRVKCSVE